ncbi:methionyl-tRNA formyltransferase [Actinorhabdospora filicis]|uniref:Methionyl-tRNA formyltransferase n=1 Tax=Actinorhabdospora filicis TaxID=1785913 RepID=A0A9W6SM96_9ACTN|nr:formyltransferase family protein [Actinorhabdospora filicis]GLZ78583.1 methionyl-tRNA formyltransferase [Actinorhabdospora filicis]
MRVVLFSEINSKLGSPFLSLLSGHPMAELIALVTSPPGRRCSYFVHDERQVDLEAQARGLGVPVLRPRRVNEPEAVAALRALRADYFIVGNFQQILSPELLAVPAVTCVNFHPSPLPRYAGLAPFYWMVRHGERDGAVTAIEMAPGPDTGAIIRQNPMPLTGAETALELRTAQERENSLMLLELIPQLRDRSFSTVAQDLSRRTYFGRPGAGDYQLDFTRDAVTVERAVRAGYRHPGAHTARPDGSRLVILSAEPGSTRLALDEPGTVRRCSDGWHVAAADAWLRVLTVEHDGAEVPAEALGGVLADHAVLGREHSSAR